MATAVLHTRSERFVDGSCYKHHGSEIKHKRGRQKTVKWPINEKLCEVRYFLVDDAPSILGMRESYLFAHNVPFYPESKNLAGDHLSEAKRFRFTHVTQPHGNLAAGVGLSMAKSLHVPKVELETSMICAAPWHCPHTFIPDDSWLWAGGEDSLEVVSQKQREMRVFEAFYPRLASVPDSPAEPLESPADNSCMLSVPLIPLEEDETEDIELEEMIENKYTDISGPDCTVMFDASKLGADALNCKDGIMPKDSMAESVKLNQLKVMNEADSNIAAVAAAACMVVKSLGESDLVDEKLLLAILKNPSLLKSLTCSSKIVPNKSQVKNNAAGSRVSQELITSMLGKQPLDHGAYLNASPVSVLARWDDGAFMESPHGTSPTANEDAHTQQRGIEISNPATAIPPITSLPSEAPFKTTHIGRDFSQPGLEIATRAVSEVCKNSTFKAPTLQESSMSHAYKLEEDVRFSRQNVSHNNLVSASCSMQSTAPSSSSVRSTSLSNSEHPWRGRRYKEPPRRKVAHDPDSKPLQAKMVVPPSMAGGGRAKRFCMYFNSPRGCRNGSSCAFVHQSLDSELNTMAL